MQTTPRPSRRPLFALAVAALVVSGLAQMPVFKRYYVADVPGLACTADYLFTHVLHYAAAAVYLFLLASRAGAHLARRLRGEGAPATLRQRLWAALHAAVAATGLMLAAKNLDGWHWRPALTMALDWSHLALALALLAAFALALRRRTHTP